MDNSLTRYRNLHPLGKYTAFTAQGIPQVEQGYVLHAYAYTHNKAGFMIPSADAKSRKRD